MNIDIDLKYEDTFTLKNLFDWYQHTRLFKLVIIAFLCIVFLLAGSILLFVQRGFYIDNISLSIFTIVIFNFFCFIIGIMNIAINQSNVILHIFGIRNPDLILTISDNNILLRTESIELPIYSDAIFSYIINKKGIYFSTGKIYLIAFLPVESEHFHFVCDKIKGFKSHKSTNRNKFTGSQRIFPSEERITDTYKLCLFLYLPSTAALITAIIHCFYQPIDFPILFIIISFLILFSKPIYRKRVSSSLLLRQQHTVNVYDNTLVLTSKFVKRLYSLDEINVTMCTSSELQITNAQVVFSVFENEQTKEEWSLLIDKLKI